MRTLGYVVVGALIGALSAVVLMLVVVYVALPLAGKGDPMVQGISGAIVLYAGTPVLAFLGSIFGFVLSRRLPRPRKAERER